MDAHFLDLYDRELAYLRELGGEFAAQFPKVAGRLGLSEFACDDPYVERLLEGFAFMSARVRRKLDAEFPQFTRALFDAVFPHYGRPLPSSGIFQLQPDLQEGSLIEGYRVPKGSRLSSEPARGEQTGCRFDTVWDTDLWPIRLTEVEFFSRDAALGFPVPKSFHSSDVRSGLQFTIEAPPGIRLDQLKMDRLRLHLRGSETAMRLYEAILAHTITASARCGRAGAWHDIDTAAIRSVGWSFEECLLPQEPRSFSGYQLLQEYFLLPEKFLFIDIEGLSPLIAKADDGRLKLLLGFDSAAAELVGRVTADHLALHCVPAVNLFVRRADRIHLDHTQHEHQLISDRSRPLDFEVWSVIEMAGHMSGGGAEVPYLPMYAPPAADADRERHAMYYALERRPRLLPENPLRSRRSSYLGSEVFVMLTDSGQEPFRHDIKQLSSVLYCTNRDLPLLRPECGWRDAFSIESGGPIAKVICLNGPTPPRNPPLSDDGEVCRRLVSHLTPNYLSLTDNAAGGAAMLREMLQLYCPDADRSAARQIEGVLNIRSKSIVRRIPLPGPMAYGRGTEIEVTCDEQAFAGGGAFLLGCVLEQFFARYTSLNSFTETRLSSPQRGTIAAWPARFGFAPML